MISKVHNEQDYIVAVVEWKAVDKNGLEMEHGEYIYLQNLWIHPDHRGQGHLETMIADILMKAPDARYGYFTREKFNHRMSRCFKRSSVENIVKEKLNVQLV